LRAARGFTLLELLVAVALLAALAALSLRGLGSILDAEAHARTETRHWGELALVMGQLGQDLSLALSRPERGAGGELIIARLGDAEGGAAQAGPRRVGYRLRDGALEYLLWPPAGARAASEPAANAVLQNVAALELRVLGADGAWTPLQPGPGAAQPLPRALEARLVLAGGERVTRLFLLR